MWNGPSPPEAIRAPGAPGAPEGPQPRDPEIHTRPIKSPGVEIWSGKPRAMGGRAPGAPAGALSI